MKSFHFFVLVWGLLLLSACGAPKNLFVLMPNSDGTVGKISVKNDAGEQIVTSAGTGVKVKGVDTAPAPPKPVSDKYVQETFMNAINATPQPAIRFSLQFEFGTTILIETSQALLPEIIVTVKEWEHCDVRIIGHADAMGPTPENWELGLQRAKTVKQILVDQGIDTDRIEAISHGETDLLISTPDGVGEPKNRRAEVFVK